MDNNKQATVATVFQDAALRYDLMNDLMSAGLHRYWKRFFTGRMRFRPGQVLYDVAGGTGDIAILARRRCPGLEITIIDPGVDMIAQGKIKTANAGIFDLTWVCAPAEALPMPDASADILTISFGLRNCFDRTKALQEFKRVLRPGGQFFCLEFSHVRVPGLNRVYQKYLETVVPLLGEKVAGSRDAYQYLCDSIKAFPKPQALVWEMTQAGFADVAFTPLSAGIVAVHSGRA